MNNTQSVISGRALGFVFVILIHAGLFYALMTGLSKTMVELLTGPMETEIIEESVKDDAPPPPPPPDFKPPPPAFVDMPMVSFDSAPASAAIQNVTNVVK